MKNQYKLIKLCKACVRTLSIMGKPTHLSMVEEERGNGQNAAKYAATERIQEENVKKSRELRKGTTGRQVI